MIAVAEADLPFATTLPLVSRAASGDLAAQDEVIAAYQRRIAGFLLAMTGETAAVDDLCQETFVRMLRGLPRLRDHGQFERWLFRIARNVATSHLRRRRWTRLFDSFCPARHDLAAPPTPAHDGAEAWLLGALQRLPVAQREVLVLFHTEGLSYEALAGRTGSTVASVKSRLFRAREQLRAWRSECPSPSSHEHPAP